MLGLPFDAKRAADLGLVTAGRGRPEPFENGHGGGAEAGGEARGALQASKKLMKRSFREQIKTAMKVENEEFSVQVRSDDAKEALTAFLEKRSAQLQRNRK